MVGTLLIINVLYIILPNLYRSGLNLLACSCLCEMYANVHVLKIYLFYSKINISNNFNLHLKFKFTLELHKTYNFSIRWICGISMKDRTSE